MENTAPAQLDLAVRGAGWHFMWLESACTRAGWGLSDQTAGTRAITRALAQTLARFNGAELGTLRVSRYFGVRIATAKMHSRHIQQSASLDFAGNVPLPQLG